jgi:hypothetical protein
MAKSKGRKCKSQEASITATMEDVKLPDRWKEKLLALGPNLSNILGALANEGQISASHIKKARTGQPSFSYAKWTELTPEFGLPHDLTMVQFDDFLITAV